VIVEQYDTTLLVPPDFDLECDACGNVVLTRVR
jgi:hypothetical protein